MRNCTIIERLPSATEFLYLRQLVGWPNLDEAMAEKALKASLYSVCVELNNNIIGIGRVVGDGSLYFYIQDLMIHPQYQGCGLGKRVLQRLLAYIDENAMPGSFIGIMSAKGKEGFYKKFGFEARPNEIYGAGMFIYK